MILFEQERPLFLKRNFYGNFLNSFFYEEQSINGVVQSAS